MSLLAKQFPIFAHSLFTEYPDENLQELRDRENRRPFLNQSPQQGNRHQLIEFIKNLSDGRFSRPTVHLAVYYLDFFMDHHCISSERLLIVAGVCLMLAAKIEEQESHVPKLSELANLIDDAPPIGDFVVLERMIVKFFDWHLIKSTAAHFMELFVELVVLVGDYQTYVCKQSPKRKLFGSFAEMKKWAAGIAFEFLDLSLSDLRMSVDRSSQLAAAVIMVTRYTIEVAPLWPIELQRVTGYEMAELDGMAAELVHLKSLLDVKEVAVKRKRNSPDSGYFSLMEVETDSDEDTFDDEQDLFIKKMCLWA